MAKDVIVGLDFPDAEHAWAFLSRFGERKLFLKIGMELFYSAGADFVRRVREEGHKIFLDLKLHDIPNTVKSAMRVLSKLDVDMCNLHAAGAGEMMKAALEGLSRPDRSRPILIAVTQLTSTSDQQLKSEILIDTPMNETVLSYAMNAKRSGLDGVVCSPHESMLIKQKCGTDFITVTPGVRFSDSSPDDQTRIMTPKKAAENGSDYIVMVRPITQAADPVAAYNRAVTEFCL